MIAMVCVSVLSTGVVMHISGISQPMPRWIQRIFLDIIPRLLCLSPLSVEYESVEAIESLRTRNHKDSDVLKNGKENAKPTNAAESSFAFAKFEDHLHILKFIKQDMIAKNKDIKEQLLWKRLSKVVDRILLYLFTFFTVLCTLILSIQIIRGSEMEYDEILRELEEF